MTTEHESKVGPDDKKNLHITVNRRKFESGDGVKPEMTGAEIAGLVEVPADNAVVRDEKDKTEVAIDQTVHVKNGDRFLVTRKTVEGGHE